MNEIRPIYESYRIKLILEIYAKFNKKIMECYKNNGVLYSSTKISITSYFGKNRLKNDNAILPEITTRSITI